MFDIQQEITNRIIAELEQGSIPWQKPWFGSGKAIKRSNGEPYSILNEMLLGPGEYASFKQVHESGGKVKKGAKGRMVVFWKMLSVMDKDTDEEKVIPLLRYNIVFRIGTDTEGIEPKYYKPGEGSSKPHAETIEAAQNVLNSYIQRSGVKLIHEVGDTACYRPTSDSITLPELKQFRNSAEYYGTAFHEAVHSTGHITRLNRLTSPAHFGSESYSKEELVAELGSASILNIIGIETAGSFRNSAAYIQSWLGALKNDKTLLISATSRAQKAVDLIMGSSTAARADA